MIAGDPYADLTDVYAFVSPDKPDFVTLMMNAIPYENPAGGPNFYQFDPNVVYEIHVDNNADAVEPGLFGPGNLPNQQRRDYELNANDSAWLANANAPITGYSRIVGTIGTERSPRM